MRKLLTYSICLLFTLPLQADTLAKYAGIANSIPQAQLKADEKSQAWARSAKSILDVADESIAQSIQAMQNLALRKRMQLFCLPADKTIDNNMVHQILNHLIQQNYDAIAQQSISEVVVSQLEQLYPCTGQASGSQQVQGRQQQPQPMFGRNDYQMQSVRR